MTEPKLEEIRLRRDGKVVYASFDRPEHLNAFGRRMERSFRHLIDWVTHDERCDILVLSGEGKAFSAGADFDFMQENIDHPERFDISSAKQVVFSMLDCPKPIIAKINGDAVGLGATLALFCDVSFAADSARIGDPHVRAGYVAGDGGAVIWPQLVGYARAKEYLLTGSLLDAPEAARIGLINRAVPAAELDAVVEEFANKLARGATMAIRWTKMSINIGLKQLATATMDASMAYEALSNLSADHREAVAAFVEKRRPAFTGK
jgi:enoyl-CoA hydratase